MRTLAAPATAWYGCTIWLGGALINPFAITQTHGVPPLQGSKHVAPNRWVPELAWKKATGALKPSSECSGERSW